MHIIKQSSKMKRYTQLIVVSGIASSLGGFAHAHEAHNQMLQMNQASQQQMVVMETSKIDHQTHEQSKLVWYTLPVSVIYTIGSSLVSSSILSPSCDGALFPLHTR